MPENTRSSRLPFVATAFAVGAVIVAGGAVAATVLAQSAAADDTKQRISAQILNESTGPRSEQLALTGAFLAKRTADAVAAVAAANAAYLASPAGAQATARNLAASQYGWGDDQFGCLVRLWDRESGWSLNAYNPDGGATGIPQALPGEKMAIAGADWQTNPATQIAWGLGYIASSYGTPCGAWGHSESYNWY